MPSYKGRFRPKNPQKYKGDPTNIIWRSSWELRAFKWCDRNDKVLEWQSEEIAVPYLSPVDGRWHRYFPDIVAKVLKKDGTSQTYMLEIKPEKQTKEPKVQKKRTKKYLTEVATWGINTSKWKAAEEYCLDRGWIFKLITEKELGIK